MVHEPVHTAGLFCKSAPNLMTKCAMFTKHRYSLKKQST